MYPVPEREMEAVVAERKHLWQEMAQEREIGRQLWQHIGLGMIKNEVTDAEFRTAILEAEQSVRGLVPGAVAFPVAPARAAVVGLGRRRGEKGFGSPIIGPARILSRYDEGRTDDKGNAVKHRGIDIGASEGTAVFSVEEMQILKIGEDPQLGRFIDAGLKTEDGKSYAGSPNWFGMGDPDAGTVVRYAHLGPNIIVQEGQVVPRGQPIASVGASGLECSAGCVPQLHLEMHKLWQGQDTTLDPLGFIPERFITHQDVAGGQSVERGAPRSIAAHVATPQGAVPVTSIVTGNQSTVVVGPGTVVQTDLSATIPVKVGLGQGPSDILSQIGSQVSQFADQFLNQVGQVAPGIKEVAAQFIPQAQAGGKAVIEGVGSLGGKFFEIANSPVIAQGFAKATEVAGGGMQLAGKLGSAASGMLSTALGLSGPIAGALAPVAPSVGAIVGGAIGALGGPGGSGVGAGVGTTAGELMKAYAATAPIMAPMVGVGGGLQGALHQGVGGIMQSAGQALGRGAKGGMVSAVQQALNNASGASIVQVDGDFGPGTENAVKAFQQAMGLKADGVVGPATMSKLGLVGPPAPPAHQIAQAQSPQLAQSLGLIPGMRSIS
jgi:murein DD-endopeptidase MepM/ murein hydrolase activator NlpD